MLRLGCPKLYNVGENVHCVSCPGQIGGGYHPPSQAILLCQNRIKSQVAMIKTLSHEMIHAFDDCRADIDWTDCVHHACTEVGQCGGLPGGREITNLWAALQIRASNLSRECRWVEEFKRGF